MKAIRIQGISKEFFSLRGRTAALKEVTLKTEPGTFFVLLGPSGCGKSTLLNIVAGIEKPSAGEVYIGDQPVVSVRNRIFLTPRERNVAMVFQSYALYPHMTVFDNIAFPLRIARVSRSEIRARVDEVAGTLEISDLLEAKPAELSGGQRQRVAIGRAIVRRPKVLLLDEPLSNLDAQLRINMRAELKRMQKRLKVTTIYVTHDQTEAMTLGDMIAVLKDGRIQQIGTPGQIYDDPRNLFVARFVGTPTMNLLNGEILDRSQKDLKVKKKVDKNRVILGLRPEHVWIASGEETGAFKGEATLLASLGSQTLVYLRVGGQDVVTISSHQTRLKEGQPVEIDFDERRLFVFRKDDGRRIDMQD